MSHLLGVDVGSSDCKVMLINTQGDLVCSTRISYATSYPRPGWVEQAPEDWYRTACTAIRRCLGHSGVNPQSVVAMSIDGPAHNVALMDATGNVVRPTLHWSDLRSAAQAEVLEKGHGDRIFALTYSRVNPSSTLSQLLWLRENEPEAWGRLRRVLVTKDYVRYRLTGDYGTDIYDAIGTQLYDVEASEWSNELCDLVCFRQEWLPTVRASGAVGGWLHANAAQDTGLPEELPVAVGSGDSVVEALGVGAIAPGDCLVKIGTAANVNLVTSSALPSRQSITYRHLVQPGWFSITATNSGTSTMRWFRDAFCRSEVEEAQQEGLDVYDLITALAAGVPPGCEGLIFHPYLNGERSPYWDPYLRGDFVGINMQHRRNHFARAVLEGVAFSIRDCLDVIEGLGQSVQRMYLIGGGAKSTVWRQIVCDVLGQPLIKPRVEDAAFGAAMVAGVAVGEFASWEEAVATCTRVEASLEPQSERRDLYAELFRIYRNVTRDVRRHSNELSRLTLGMEARL